MAIVLVTIPPKHNFLNSTIRYTLRQTGNTATIKKSVAYQLEDSDGNFITPVLGYTPKENEVFPIDFSVDLLNVLMTPPPQALLETDALTFGYLQPVPEMKKIIILKYWEITTNSELCTIETGTPTPTNPVNVYNTSVDYFGETAYRGGMLSLTRKPSQLIKCKVQKDLLYFITSSTSIQAQYLLLNRLGVAIGGNSLTTLSVTANTPYYVNLMPPSTEITEDVAFVYVKIVGSSGGDIEYLIKIIECCNDRTTIAFQDSRGGMQSLYGKIVNDKSNGTSDTFSSIINNFEVSKPYNKKSFVEIDVVIPTPIKKATDKDFYLQFMSSGKYFILLKRSPESDGDILRVSAKSFAWDQNKRQIRATFASSIPLIQPNYTNG